MLNPLRVLWRRLGARRDWEQDMDAELRFHIEARTAHFIEGGMAPDEAERRARIEFGGLEAHKESCREASWAASAVDELRRNVSFALRSLRKSPAFTTVALLSLALGIGANTAMFSLIEKLMLHDLPVRDPGGLYQVGVVREEGFRSSQSYIHFDNIRANKDLFFGTSAWSSPSLMEGRIGEGVVQILTMPVSGSYFPVLGVQAHIGRLFTEQDDQVGSPNIAVLGHQFWQRELHGDTAALQRFIKVGGVPFQIIGVAPQGFYGVELGDPPDLFMPLHAQANYNKNAMTAEGMMWLHTMVRLKPGVPLGTAREILGKRLLQIGAPLRKKYGRLNTPRPNTLEPGAQGYSEVRNDFSKPLIVLTLLASVVLLVACANLSTLLYVRGAGRAGETSLRLALGATSGQLIRQWMTECMLLAAGGGVLAIILTRWMVDVLLLFVGEGPRQYLRFRPDSNIVTFALALTVSAGLLFGLLPAIRTTRVNPGYMIKEFQNSLAGRRRRHWRIVLACQIAASFVLVTGAVLFARTLWNLGRASGGFARSEVVWARPKFNRENRVRGAQMDEALEKLKPSPTFEAVSMGRLPISDGGSWNWATVPGYIPGPNEDNIVYFSYVMPGYFQTLKVELLSGRDLEAKDRIWPPSSIVVSESFAKHYFKDRDPIGVQVSVFRDQPPSTIVGVARDMNYSALRETRRDVVYYAMRPESFGPIMGRPKRSQGQAGALAEL